MGWTFQPSQGRDRVEIIRPLLDYETDTYTQKVIDHAVVGTTVYLLVCRAPKAAWKPNDTYINDADGSFRWIAVFLTSRKGRDG
jgi:sigma54-dependent transcription regulator